MTTHDNPINLILASASPRRTTILKLLEVPFSVIEAKAIEEETMINPTMPPEIMAEELALAKARAVAKKEPNPLVLGADTIVISQGQALGKPKDHKQAKTMLRQLCGTTHQVTTGLAIVQGDKQTQVVTHCSTKVTMRSYPEEDIQTYVSSGQSMDKAGAYGIQDTSFQPVQHIEGCYQNVVGLPLCTFAQLLSGINHEEPAKQTFGLQHCPWCPIPITPVNTNVKIKRGSF